MEKSWKPGTHIFQTLLKAGFRLNERLMRDIEGGQDGEAIIFWRQLQACTWASLTIDVMLFLPLPSNLWQSAHFGAAGSWDQMCRQWPSWHSHPQPFQRPCKPLSLSMKFLPSCNTQSDFCFPDQTPSDALMTWDKAFRIGPHVLLE